MAAPKTVKTYDLNGTLKDFPITFEYLARKFVTVTLIGTDRRELVLNTDYRFSTPTQITTMRSSGWGPGDGYDLIEIRRLTSATDRLVDFADGSILRAFDLNTSQIQSLHIAEEARDLTADTIGVNDEGNLDARAKRIVNVADPVEDGDVVTLRYEKAWAASTLGNKTASEVARVGSEAARDLALTYRNSAQAADTHATSTVALIADMRDDAEASEAAAEAAASIAVAQVSLATTQATNSANSATASANSATASATAKTASEAARDAASTSATQAASAGVQLGMVMWGNRPHPFTGFAVDDGQELSRATYPDFAAMLDAGLLPVVSEATWQADVTKRGCFVALSSTGNFRMRDLNGVSAGSLGANFLRGGNDAATVLKRDQLQGFAVPSISAVTPIDVASSGTPNRYSTTPSNRAPITDGINGTPRLGTETYPTHATGAWMTRLFGVITPLGSAEAASLATAYASLASRATALESVTSVAKITYDVVAGVLRRQAGIGLTVTKLDSQNVRVTFTSPMPDAYYGVQATVHIVSSGATSVAVLNKTANSFDLRGLAGGSAFNFGGELYVTIDK